MVEALLFFVGLGLVGGVWGAVILLAAGGRIGCLARLGSAWVGAHWSPYNKRLCVNLVPCVTVWFVLPGGVEP